jgi:23S rRNA G2445 N2-methylase RlmL
MEQDRKPRLPLFDEREATFFVSTIHGLEEELAQEIAELADDCKIALKIPPRPESAGVVVRAPWNLCLAMNLGLRCASRVLIEVLEAGGIRNLDDVYQQVLRLPWDNLFGVDKTFVVNATSSDSFLKAPALNLKIKDAIVDAFRRETGERPSVGKDDPQVRVVARLHRGLLTVSLDSTGLPLSGRGYRVASHDAPLGEMLAAGLMRMTGWHRLCRELRAEKPQKVFFDRVSEKNPLAATSQAPSEPSGTEGELKAGKPRRIPKEIPMAPLLVDPLCGTGTFAIEAALFLLNRRPQLERSFFAFDDLNLLPASVRKQTESMRRTLRGQELSLLDAFTKIAAYRRNVLNHEDVQEAPVPPLLCSDTNLTALEAARKNAEAAGVSKLIRFEKKNVLDLSTEAGEGLLVANLPYGVRLGEEETLTGFYKDVGDVLKKNCKGWQAWLLTGSEKLAGSVGLRATRRKKVYNGGLECLWLQYVLF